MRKKLFKYIKVYLVLISPAFLQAFPNFNNDSHPPKSSYPEWKVVKKMTIEGLNTGLFSIMLIPQSNSALISDDDYTISRINLETGTLEWKIKQKMNRSRELDGHRIFDVSPNGLEFLTDSQLDENSPSGERTLTRRSTKDGSVIYDFKPENSTFYSIEADMDHRYPGEEKAKEHLDTGRGPYWAMTIFSAEYIENGRQILAGYTHNMTGPNFFDYRLMFYTLAGKRQLEFQLVCDPKTANFGQPAGFEVGHFNLPYVYNSRRKSIIYGTTHGRILEVAKNVMIKNGKEPVVEKKPAGNVLFVPISDSTEYENKDRQTIRSLSLSPDGNTLYSVAGDNTYTQIYNYDLKKKKQIHKSEIFTLSGITSLDKNIVAVHTSPNILVDLRDNGYVFKPDDRDLANAMLTYHPEYQEMVAAISYNEFAILRPGGTDERVPWEK